MNCFNAFLLLSQGVFMAAGKPWQTLQSRIINGFDAPLNRYPYTVSLQDYSGHYCGGSVIAPDLVLSAAHCPAYSSADVVINPHNINNPQLATETFGVADTVPHPLYETINGYDHDIRIIKLDGLTSQPILRLNADETLPENGTDLQVMGWGKIGTGYFSPGSSILQEVDVVTMTNEACENAYPGDISPDMLCALENNKGSCQGDSGGPLIIQGDNSTEDIQVGIVSWGIGCAQEQNPGVYARVTEEYSWIRFQVCKLSDSPPDYFGCGDIEDNTWSPAPTSPSNVPSVFPSLEPTSPTASPAPTRDEVTVLIEIKLDNYPYTTWWTIHDSDGYIIQGVTAGRYSTSYATVYEEVTLDADLHYIFTLHDNRYGTYGRVVLYLNDEVDANKVIGYWDRYQHGSFSYSRNIPFQAGDEGILTNVFPTSAPTMTASDAPSLLPSVSPSLEPTSPTASPAPTRDEVTVLIEIKLDHYPYTTWWSVQDSEGNAIYKVDGNSYSTPYATVYEEVTLDADLDYTFTLRDSYYGTDGHVILYLGDEVDANKVIGYWDRYEHGSFSYSRNIPFQASEEGIISNRQPSKYPTIEPTKISTQPPPSRPPTTKPPTTKPPTTKPSSDSLPAFLAIGFSSVVVLVGMFVAGARACHKSGDRTPANSPPPPMPPRPLPPLKQHVDPKSSESDGELEC